MRIKVGAGWRAVVLIVAVLGAVLATACAGSDGGLTPAEESNRVTDTATTVPAAEEIAGSAETTPSSSARQESTGDQSGTPLSKSTDGEQGNGEQLEAVVLPQTTAIYFRTRAGSRSDTLKTIVQSTTGEMLGSKFIPIESTSSSLVVYSPENEEANVFHTYSSPSWAKHSKRPLTIDDQLYVETEWSSGDLDVVEYDPRRLTRGREGDKALLRAAIIGDTRYYYDYPEYSGFLGYYGYLQFVKEPQSGGEATQRKLRPPDEYRDDPDFLFTLVAWDGNLYGIKTPPSDGDPVVIYQVDQSTGEPTRIATLPIGDTDRGFFFQTKLDNGTAYWAPVKKSGASTVIQIWSYRLGDPSSKLRTTDLKVPSGGRPSSITGFDVDDGHFVFTVHLEGDSTHQLLLYDEESKSISMTDPGLVVNYAQIIHFGEPGVAPSASRTATRTTTGAVLPATPTPPPGYSDRGYAPTGPTPTLAMTPLAKPNASAFQLEVGVAPDEFSVVNFCRAESATRSICVRE